MASSPKGSESLEAREGGFVCLVDGDGHYKFDENELNKLIRHVDPDNSQDYSIVGIMGCQSTGKSTLLNHLFETKFQMMNSKTGRSQTTKGIWLDAARNTEHLVVMDLEGTDSGERGEDRTTFERQTILYGLALCEILIVNMWFTDIGRYTASNYGIMKTVFEVNLQLFKSQGKTQLLFIVRDFIEEMTPFDALEEKLRGEMEKIWAELNKPAEYANSNMDDFFDFRFEWLPHYVLQKDKFLTKVDELRQRFTDPSLPNSFLHTSYHGGKSVPVEGFARYAQSIWDTISTNQDLNLPSQRELLATFRCDEVAQTILRDFEAALGEHRANAQATFLPDLGARLGAAVATHLNQFDELTRKYAPVVVERKRAELRGKLLAPCDAILAAHVQRFLVEDVANTFASALRAGVRDDTLCPDLYLLTSQLKADFTKEFKTACARLASGLTEASDAGMGSATVTLVEEDAEQKREDAAEPRKASACTVAAALFERYLPQLEARMDGAIEAVRKQQLQVLALTAAARLQERLSEPVQECLRTAGADMWQQLGSVFSAQACAVSVEVEEALDKLANDDDERAAVIRGVVETAEASVREVAQQHARLVPLKMKAAFDSVFSRQDGARRVWGAKDNVRVVFSDAKERALALLELFRTFRLRQHWKDVNALLPATTAAPALGLDVNAECDVSPAVSPSASMPALDQAKSILARRPSAVAVAPATEPNTVALLTQAQVDTYKQDFLVDVEGLLHDALLERERNMAQARLPPWAIVMMLVLGYNEIMAILKNPLFLVLAVLLGVAAFVVNAMGMWGPVTSMLRSALEQALTQLNALLAQGNAVVNPATEDAVSDTISARKASAVVGNGIDLDNLPALNKQPTMIEGNTLTRRVHVNAQTQ